MKDDAKSPSQQGHWRQVELPGSIYKDNIKPICFTIFRFKCANYEPKLEVIKYK